MKPELSRRAARAMTIGMPDLAERDRIVEAAQTAEEFEDLPADIQALILRLEGK